MVVADNEWNQTIHLSTFVAADLVFMKAPGF